MRLNITNNKKLILFHHEPFRSDNELVEIEKKAQQLFPNTIVAKQYFVRFLIYFEIL